MKCHKCGREMVVKTNSNTKEKFWGCSSYPHCSVTRSYKDKDENIKNIETIITLYEKQIRERLNISKKVIVVHFYDEDMDSGVVAFIRPLIKDYIEIHWNIQLTTEDFSKVLKTLAHEYTHVKQFIDERLNDYDVEVKWRCRPEEDEAIKFAQDFVNDVIVNVG